MPLSIRSALVLAAGLGTRLQPLTLVRAKPAIPVAGEALVRRIARWLVGRGVRDVLVNLHHLPATVTAVLGDGSDIGARVRYSWEQPIVLGSAGGPRQALGIVGDETFFVVNGDTLTDLDLGALDSAHRSSAALVTMALTSNREPHRYGGVLLDGTRVIGFAKRNTPEAAGSFHFIGVQAAAARVFLDVPEKRAANSVGDVYDRLIARSPGSVRGFVSDASFMDIGTVADYVRTSRAIAGGLSRAIVWDGATVDPAAEVDDCIVTDGVHVPAGAKYRHAVLLRGPNGETVCDRWTDDRG